MEALAPLQGVFSHQYQQLIDRSRYVYVEANIMLLVMFTI